jgi:hypothetical protein
VTVPSTGGSCWATMSAPLATVPISGSILIRLPSNGSGNAESKSTSSQCQGLALSSRPGLLGESPKTSTVKG